MVCIYCGGELAVSNSRPQKSRNQTWRRRLCKGCGAVFTSIEAIDLSQAITVTTEPAKAANNKTTPKSPLLGTLQPFDRDKLFISLYKSLQHRPTAASDARGLLDTITAHIIAGAEHSQIGRRTIIDIVMNTLTRFDAAAATHYAAFHGAK